jgi:hypothetical protein
LLRLQRVEVHAIDVRVTLVEKKKDRIVVVRILRSREVVVAFSKLQCIDVNTYAASGSTTELSIGSRKTLEDAMISVSYSSYCVPFLRFAAFLPACLACLRACVLSVSRAIVEAVLPQQCVTMII